MKYHLLGFVLSCLAISTNADELNPGEGFISVGDGPVWYKVSGEGPGLPLLVLHGGPGGTSCGQSLLDALGDERPVIRYDQLGTGRSGRRRPESRQRSWGCLVGPTGCLKPGHLQTAFRAGLLWVCRHQVE